MTNSLQRMCVGSVQMLYMHFIYRRLERLCWGYLEPTPKRLRDDHAQEDSTGVVRQAILFQLSRSAELLAPMSSSNVTKIHPATKAPASKGFSLWESWKLRLQAELLSLYRMCRNTGGRAPDCCHESVVPLDLSSPRLQDPAVFCGPRKRAPSAPQPMGDASRLGESASHPSAGLLVLPWAFLFRMQHTLSHRVGVRFPGQPIKALLCSICRACHCDSLWP